MNIPSIMLVQQCQQRQDLWTVLGSCLSQNFTKTKKSLPFCSFSTEDQHQMHKTLRSKCSGGSKAKEEGMELVQQGCWIPWLYSQKISAWEGTLKLGHSTDRGEGLVPVGLLSSVCPQVTGQVCRSRENLATVSVIKKYLIRQQNLQWLRPSLSCTGCTAQSSQCGSIGMALVQEHLNKSIQQMSHTQEWGWDHWHQPALLVQKQGLYEKPLLKITPRF